MAQADVGDGDAALIHLRLAHLLGPGCTRGKGQFNSYTLVPGKPNPASLGACQCRVGQHAASQLPSHNPAGLVPAPSASAPNSRRAIKLLVVFSSLITLLASEPSREMSVLCRKEHSRVLAMAGGMSEVEIRCRMGRL